MAKDPTSESDTVRVAVVQAAPVLFDTQRTLEKLADWCAKAARENARLVVFPEAFIGGYPKGQDFGVRLGIRTPEGREIYRRYHQAAVEIPGPDCEAIAAVARGHSVYIIVGVVERDGGTLYCTVLTFGSDGRLLGKHRKLMPTAMERVVWGAGDGSPLSFVETPFGKLSAVICWENYMPLLRTALYGKGIELYCAITVDDRETWLPTVRHIALEGRCFVLSACQVLRQSELPQGYSSCRGSTDQEWLIRGGSCIIGPLGDILAQPVYEKECILTADLVRADLVRARFDLDVVGHYARSDRFQLLVDETPRHAVTFTTQNAGGPVVSKVTLVHVPGSFAICQLPADEPVPAWAVAGPISNITRTAEEVSVVCEEHFVPEGIRSEKGWKCLRVAGSMPFTQVGVLASITMPLARAGVSVFAFSTFDTDYLLVKKDALAQAISSLRASGWTVQE